MRKFRFFMPFGLLIVAAIFSSIVMMLWNWLMPAIFGIAAISIWQAGGLFVLARILFGSFGFFDRARMMHERYHDEAGGHSIHKKWMRMSDEQRREFIEKRRKFGFGRPHPFDMGEHHDEAHGAEEKGPDGE